MFLANVADCRHIGNATHLDSSGAHDVSGSCVLAAIKGSSSAHKQENAVNTDGVNNSLVVWQP